MLAVIGVAALAGLVSFFAPCMLPLVPGYISYVTGLAGADLDAVRERTSGTTAVMVRGRVRMRILAGSGLFVLGFSAVFTTVAYAVGELGRALLVHSRAIEIVVGFVIIGLGLAFLGLFPGLDRTVRVQRLPAVGLAGAPILGATFALSWTPCLSPTLTAVLGLAAVEGSANRGAILAAAYSLGMGLPFIAFALGLRWMIGAVDFIRRHGRWITWIGGLLLIIVGFALATGAWTYFINWLRATVGPGQIGI
nr:cytochrome c biogenesis protein CcdA [Glycomyces tenuis]